MLLSTHIIAKSVTYGLSGSSIKGKHCAKRLIYRAQRKRRIKKIYGDGEYDFKPLYENAVQHQFEVVYRPRRTQIQNQAIIQHERLYLESKGSRLGRI